MAKNHQKENFFQSRFSLSPSFSFLRLSTRSHSKNFSDFSSKNTDNLSSPQIHDFNSNGPKRTNSTKGDEKDEKDEKEDEGLNRLELNVKEKKKDVKFKLKRNNDDEEKFENQQQQQGEKKQLRAMKTQGSSFMKFKRLPAFPPVPSKSSLFFGGRKRVNSDLNYRKMSTTTSEEDFSLTKRQRAKAAHEKLNKIYKETEAAKLNQKVGLPIPINRQFTNDLEVELGNMESSENFEGSESFVKKSLRFVEINLKPERGFCRMPCWVIIIALILFIGGLLTAVFLLRKKGVL